MVSDSSRGTLRDRAGNTLKGARGITLQSMTGGLKDWIGRTDRNDFYKFTIGTRSSVELSLGGLRANADLALLDRNGKVLQRSTYGGRNRESIDFIAEPGTYYIQVYPARGNTDYRLVGTTSEANFVATSLPPASPNPPGSFDIQFDYRFDTNGWVTPERRAVLDKAASLWENIIRDEFENVPVGTRLNVRNPQTGTMELFDSEYEIDDLVIFVGARNLGGADGTLALGGPSGYWYLGSRLDARYNGSQFQPWTASIAFDSSESWFVDSTPDISAAVPYGQDDLFSVAVHEIGHALGISESNAFNRLITNNRFMGNQARALNGGNAIPLTEDNHISDDFVASSLTTEAAMDPTLTEGTRKRLNRLDAALLADIGYSVVYA